MAMTIVILFFNYSNYYNCKIKCNNKSNITRIVHTMESITHHNQLQSLATPPVCHYYMHLTGNRSLV